MASTVIHQDLEKFLTAYIRTALAALSGNPYAGVFVGTTFWKADPQVVRDPPPFQVVVRDDGGPRTSVATKESLVGFSVLGGGDHTDSQGVVDLALLVAAIVEKCPVTGTDNPVAAVLQMNGPFGVLDPSGRATRYFTATFSLVGRPFYF